MEQVTIGQIASIIGTIVAIGGGVAVIAGWISKSLKKYLTMVIKQEIEPLKESVARIETELKKTDKEACKNFLVTFLSNVDRGEAIDEIERQRFFEEWEHYTSNGGNGYLHAKVDRLREKGLL